MPEVTRRSMDAHRVLPKMDVLESQCATVPLRQAIADALGQFPGHDIAVVRCGAELPFAWDARLAKGTHAHQRTAAAVPLCDASPLHALLEVAPEGTHVATSLLDRSAYCLGTRGYYETPVLHPVCAYLRAEALGAIAPDLGDAPDEDGAALDFLSRRWRALGWQSVVLDYLYAGFGGRLEDAAVADPVEISAFARHSPLAGLRRAVADAAREGLPAVSAPALDERPVQLHIMHFWGGGLDKWVRDFSRADNDATNLMLATYRIGETGGQRVVLYSDPDARMPIRTWDIAKPLRSTANRCIEYAAILEEVVREFAVDAVIVSSLIGHSLDALRLPVKTILVAHDFYPICQAINPRCDGVCPGCAVEDLPACSAANTHYATLGSPQPAEWRALRNAYVELLLERGLDIVMPTASALSTVKRLEPRLADARLRVIAHGSDFAPARIAPAPAVQDGRLRLIVLGRVAENKGAFLLKEAAAGLREIADVTLVGCGPNAMALARDCGWEAIEEYRHDQLAAIVGSINPHAAILASVVPETFSYTLSELWALGIVPVATRLGSFAERIRDGVDGFLFEPNSAALLGLLGSLRSNPAGLARVADTIAAFPAGRGTAEMVRDYRVLLPTGSRAPARFTVGLGAGTALTEPYRHLAQAYAQLTEAYAQLSTAYEQRGIAYEHARAEFETANRDLRSLQTLWDEYDRQFRELNVGRLWWRAPQAQRLASEMRAKLKDEATAASGDPTKT